MKRDHNFIDRDGSTPLDHEQLVGIRFAHLTTMGELDELEDENIQKGLEWLHRQKAEDFLSPVFLCRLHEKLFGDVWKWAGKYRTVEVNISKYRCYDVGPQLINLFEDLKLWISSETMPWNEIAAELHHRLVSIHPFPNGNGRTTRIFTEYVMTRYQQDPPSWMASLSSEPKRRRENYIRALRAADKGDLRPLMTFMAEIKARPSS